MAATGGILEIRADLALDARAALGEGPIWDLRDDLLWWVDITDSALHSFHPRSGDDQRYELGTHVGAVVPRLAGGLMLAVKDGFAAFDPVSGAMEMIAHPEGVAKARMRFNDGKCDPSGRFWAGTMAYDGAAGAGTLWRLDPDRSVHAMIRNVSISNGLAWDERRGIFYFIDSSTYQVVAYDYDDASGAITDRRVVIEVPRAAGIPDGMAIDIEGRLWIAHWGGGQVLRWDPESGAVLARVRVPALQSSACAFGGSELDRLYITSARQNLGPERLREEPLNGGLFVARVPVAGIAAHGYRG